MLEGVIERLETETHVGHSLQTVILSLSHWLQFNTFTVAFLKIHATLYAPHHSKNSKGALSVTSLGVNYFSTIALRAIEIYVSIARLKFK